MKYRVIYKGQILKGAEFDQVAQRLASALKTDLKIVHKLFSGKTLVICKDADLKSCRKLKAVFDKAGAICRIEPQKPPGDHQAPSIASDGPGSRRYPYLQATIFTGVTRTRIQTISRKMVTSYWRI
jgi:hypothetical protein